MPAQANINIYQGDDYQAQITVLNADGTNTDLSLYTVQSEIRTSYADSSEPPFANFSIGTSGNIITLMLTHDQTKNFNAIYVWDIQLIDASGWITTILAGKVMVTPEVTKLYSATGAMTMTTTTRLNPSPPRRRLHEGELVTN